MATRRTLEEAQRLADAWTDSYPDLRIVIREVSAPWEPDDVLYDVLEERICVTCGKKFLTAGIAMDGSECGNCVEDFLRRRAEEGRQMEEESYRRTIWSEWFDRTDGAPE